MTVKWTGIITDAVDTLGRRVRFNYSHTNVPWTLRGHVSDSANDLQWLIWLLSV